MNDRFNTQLHHMKNKTGVFRDPVFSMSYPWIIPKFTLTSERTDGTTPSVFTITQEFHRGKPLDDRELTDEMQFWQYKHYEKFHVSDSSVLWGPYDIAMCNLLFDGTQICFVDNQGFGDFVFKKDDHSRYKVMSVINPHIGEYMTGKDSNTPYEIIRDDWSRHDGVKVFFKRLFLYEKLIFNFADRHLEGANLDGFSQVNLFHKRLLLFQNWFHHEGEKVMQMTDQYVKPQSRLKVLDRKNHPDLFHFA